MRFRRRNPATGAGFGYRSAWLAVADAGTDQVVELLGLRHPATTDWDTGITASQEPRHRVAVLPPLPGAGGRNWVLATGVSLDADPHADLDALSAAAGGEVQAYATHRVVELHRWARSAAGVTTRAVSVLGETGEVERWTGRPDEHERALGLPDLARLDEEQAWEVTMTVDEETVLTLAAAWSLDPREITPVPVVVGALPRSS